MLGDYRLSFLLVWLLSLNAPALATPTILPCHAERVRDLLDPYGGERDIVAGWRCTSIAMSNLIAMTFSRGADWITLELHDRDWNGDARYHTKHFRIAVTAAPQVTAAELAAVGKDVSAVIAGNDSENLWYDPRYSPFPIDQPHPCISARAVAIVVALLLLLAGVAVHGWRSGDSSRRPAGDPLPAVSSREGLGLGALVAGALAGLGIPAYLRWDNFGIHSADMGIYTHAFWNAWQGNGFFNSPEGLDHLGSHASPGLYLVLPFYALAPHPLTLLFLNLLALVSGAIPAYLIARRHVPAAASLVCVAIYLVNPALRSLSYDVHEVTFAVPALLWALLFLQCRRPVLLALTLVLAMSFKENIGLTTLFVGAFVLVWQRRVHLGIGLMLLGVLWVVAGINLLIPYFGGNHGSDTMMRYAALGEDWLGLLLSPVRRPSVFFATVFSVGTLTYLWSLLSPFGLLPLLSPANLFLAIPTLAENLLDQRGELRSGQFHYEAILLPIVFVAFVSGMARLIAFVARTGNRNSRRARRVQVASLGLILVSQPLHCNFGRPWLLDVGGDSAREEIVAIIRRVPAMQAVISPQHIQPHLSDRPVSAYFHDETDLVGDHPPFDLAVVPVSIRPPEALYEIVWQGSAYALFRLRKGGDQ